MAYIGSKPANKPVVASDLDPTVITGQTALAVAPADTDEFLISDAGVLKRLDASLIGGANTPAFSVSRSSSVSTSSNAFTLITFDTEEFDSANQFDTTNNYYKITETGKYFVQVSMRVQSPNNTQQYMGVAIYKSTASNFSSESQIVYSRILTGYGNHSYNPEEQHTITDILSLSSGDYLRVKSFTGDGRTIYGDDTHERCTTWSMMKVIGA